MVGNLITWVGAAQQLSGHREDLEFHKNLPPFG
jgi:hypothetical protein